MRAGGRDSKHHDLTEGSARQAEVSVLHHHGRVAPALAIASKIDVYIRDMNSTELFLLGRRLIKLAEEGLPGQGGNTNARFVLLDVSSHPGSSISEITARTRFPQSHVSMLVTRLRDRGLLRTEVDPRDRRRTLVYIVPEAVRRAQRRITSTVEGPIARALATTEPDEVAEVVDALHLVAVRLGIASAGTDAKVAS
jgi:DNA-binding MarR family transcriptional regulator